MPPQQSSEYDFIMEPQKQSSGPAFLQNPKQSKVVLILFGLVIFFVLIIGWSFISSIGKDDQNDLISMVAYQYEIVRVSDLGLETSTDLTTRNQVSTLRAFISSDQSGTISYLGINGVEVSEEQQAAFTDTTTDDALVAATQTRNFDSVLEEQLDNLMQGYASVVGGSLGVAEGVNKQALLEQAANNITTYYGTN